MKSLLITLLALFVLACYGLEVNSTGPVAESLTCGNYQQMPFCFGGRAYDNNGVFVEENGTWNFYSFGSESLPVSSTWNLDNGTIMVAMGNGSYSDGVYNLTLDPPAFFTINEWFFRPNFIRYNPANSLYYVGERDGLFKSADADNWTRITAVGTNECNSLAFYETHIVTNNGSSVLHSNTNGQTWQTAYSTNLRGFRYSSDGTLYAIMNAGSDSDGLWRSDDFGANWNCVLITSNLSCIGPDFGEYIVLGWSQPNEEGNYLALVNQQYQLTQLDHATLDSEVKQLDIFPLVNTPSFYVINGEGCYFLTGFLPVDNDDAFVPAVSEIQLKAYPNPFSQSINIKVDSSDKTNAMKVEIYNLKGQLVKRLGYFGGEAKTVVTWDGKDFHNISVDSGIYLVLVKQNNRQKISKILLL